MNERVQISNLKRNHMTWRDDNFKYKKGFFPVFAGFKGYMKQLSPGAISLFLYFGMNSNNLTGECTHSLARIADFFNKSIRTISMWVKELEDAKLIKRIQPTFNGNSHTFILPYDSPKIEDKLSDENNVNISSKDMPF